jgi:hypothetical protein
VVLNRHSVHREFVTRPDGDCAIDTSRGGCGWTHGSGVLAAEMRDPRYAVSSVYPAYSSTNPRFSTSHARIKYVH